MNMENKKTNENQKEISKKFELPKSQKKNSETVVKLQDKPKAFHYIDYREYLRDAYNYKKSINSSYSESAFIQAAGFGKSSRGYFGLIIKGKRNLTTKTIYGFSKALRLGPKETMYLENMVYFNQAKAEEEKIFFFERMKVSAQGEKGEAFEVLQSQYRYISNWYLVALRELVNLEGFKEDPSWIVKKMRGQVTKGEAAQGIEDLINIGLLTRDQKGKLVQSEPIVTFSDSKHNFKNVTNLHLQFIERAKELLVSDPYEKRSARLTTLSCKKEDFESIRSDMQEFSRMLLNKYVVSESDEDTKDSGIINKSADRADVVLQLGMQLFHLTE